MKNILLNLNGPVIGFEDIKQFDQNGFEFWSARDLYPMLGYAKWQNFEIAIERAKNSCLESGQQIIDHFTGASKSLKSGNGTVRKFMDYKLSRYACYLIAQNGDPRKKEVALAQTYFTVQTRRQEVADLKQIDEDRKRIYFREEIKHENKKLFSTAKQSGVNNFGQFNDAGYWGLYNMPLSSIERKKNIKKGELLDRAGGSELSANWFRITQTEERLKVDKAKSQLQANQIHNMIGSKVRQTMKETGGKMPEDMPATKHLREVKKDLRLLDKKNNKNKTL